MKYITLLNSIIDLPKMIIVICLIVIFVLFVTRKNKSYNINLFIVATMASITASIIFELFIRNNIIYVEKKIINTPDQNQ